VNQSVAQADNLRISARNRLPHPAELKSRMKNRVTSLEQDLPRHLKLAVESGSNWTWNVPVRNRRRLVNDGVLKILKDSKRNCKATFPVASG